eukprot:9042638-Karenia_brevis.AAC.1
MHLLLLRLLFQSPACWQKKKNKFDWPQTVSTTWKSLFQQKSIPQKWHRITHRVLVVLQHWCMRRTAPEESNLATNSHPKDTTKAEFVRTYRSVTFPGLSMIRRYENEHAKMSEASTWK